MPTSKHKLTALLLVLGLAACAQQAAKPVVRPTPTPSPSPVVESPSPDPSPTPSAAPVAQAPSVVVPPPQAGPLPGQTLALSDPLAYPLLIQIENTAPARPQAGIGAASVVFQYLTEGGITRFSALFHRVPGVVGPVRSARFVSVYLFQRFDAILMCSGGAAATYNEIWATNIPSFINDFDHGVHFFRWNGRVAPHNLYTSQAQMLKVADAGYRPPSATDIARSDAWPGTEPATSVSIPDFHSSYTYANGGYTVVADGAAESDVIYGTLHPSGVAVLHVQQWISSQAHDVNGANVRDFNFQAGGAAELYAHGTVIHGRWTAPGDTGAIALTDGNGQPVGMPQGQLWVALAP